MAVSISPAAPLPVRIHFLPLPEPFSPIQAWRRPPIPPKQQSQRWTLSFTVFLRVLTLAEPWATAPTPSPSTRPVTSTWVATHHRALCLPELPLCRGSGLLSPAMLPNSPEISRLSCFRAHSETTKHFR